MSLQPGRGIGVGQSVLDRAPVPADDEQPIVDADAKADQDGQLGDTLEMSSRG